MLRADSSLQRSHDEVALLDTYALVRSNLVSKMILLVVKIFFPLQCYDILVQPY